VQSASNASDSNITPASTSEYFVSKIEFVQIYILKIQSTLPGEFNFEPLRPNVSPTASIVICIY